jgi:DNA-binding PadR family transcriptional regulator
MKELSLYETIFLLAVLHLPGNAYGLTIRSKISRRKVPYGTLYSFLDQLYRKSYVRKSLGAPTSERGGRSKVLYQVTPEGLAVLKESYRLQHSVARGLKEYLKVKA